MTTDPGRDARDPTDHPFESMREASDWFDACEIDREAIGYRNARRLFNPEQLPKPATSIR